MNGTAIYTMALSLLAESRKAEAKLPQEERERRKEEREKASAERFRKSRIISGICPSCESKLIRGKKDKRNEYKRTWICVNCDSNHSI